jgi:hypothetical protein
MYYNEVHQKFSIQDRPSTVEAPMVLLVLLAIVVMIDLLAVVFGTDSRDSRRHEYPLAGFRDAVR